MVGPGQGGPGGQGLFLLEHLLPVGLESLFLAGQVLVVDAHDGLAGAEQVPLPGRDRLHGAGYLAGQGDAVLGFHLGRKGPAFDDLAELDRPGGRVDDAGRRGRLGFVPGTGGQADHEQQWKKGAWSHDPCHSTGYIGCQCKPGGGDALSERRRRILGWQGAGRNRALPGGIASENRPAKHVCCDQGALSPLRVRVLRPRNRLSPAVVQYFENLR